MVFSPFFLKINGLVYQFSPPKLNVRDAINSTALPRHEDATR